MRMPADPNPLALNLQILGRETRELATPVQGKHVEHRTVLDQPIAGEVRRVTKVVNQSETADHRGETSPKSDRRQDRRWQKAYPQYTLHSIVKDPNIV
jgi:hypothetical protein